ncbi:MAG: hypothetical protein HC883_04385 [Bdellovibrionaceae bacterium]|nr:hypothetical protein [Pseudobdellovibrionaceae bacterium]
MLNRFLKQLRINFGQRGDGRIKVFTDISQLLTMEGESLGLIADAVLVAQTTGFYGLARNAIYPPRSSNRMVANAGRISFRYTGGG